MSRSDRLDIFPTLKSDDFRVETVNKEPLAKTYFQHQWLAVTHEHAC